VNLLLVGTNHRIAPLDARDHLTSSIGEVGGWLAGARSNPALVELFVLATCHRVEIYAATDDVRAAEAAIVRLVDGTKSGRWLGPQAPRYILTGEDAARHLCRVACGLDSVIVGEAEISGQLRRAAATAREAGAFGPYLERALAGALRASGRARAETDISRGVTSAASAGVTLATSIVGGLDDRVVVVAGAGQAGRQVLQRLARMRTAGLIVASRSERHAREAAAQSGARPVTLDQLPQHLSNADLLFTALQTPTPVVDAAGCGSRAARPLLIVDLSVPRAVDPGVAALDGVTLRTVDDLGDIARESLARRAHAVPFAEAIAHDEAIRICEQLRARAARSVEQTG
jgi:glutamyl-tRNA reductase